MIGLFNQWLWLLFNCSLRLNSRLYRLYILKWIEWSVYSYKSKTFNTNTFSSKKSKRYLVFCPRLNKVSVWRKLLALYKLSSLACSDVYVSDHVRIILEVHVADILRTVKLIGLAVRCRTDIIKSYHWNHRTFRINDRNLSFDSWKRHVG